MIVHFSKGSLSQHLKAMSFKASKALLVCEAFTIDGHSASAIAMGGISTLHHEAGDYTLDRP